MVDKLAKTGEGIAAEAAGGYTAAAISLAGDEWKYRMAEGQRFFDSPAGKVTAVIILVGGLALAGWMIWGATHNEVAAAANTRIFVDAATGKPFKVDISVTREIPAPAPSGGKTGYPAELCFWTADGKEKSEPTAVLLNSDVGKPGPTFCPDCKRLVVGHNPRPVPGARPPPTEAEYRANPSRFRGGGD